MKKVKWILLAMVLCLGLIGGAYAWWNQDVFVNSTVDTGTLKVSANFLTSHSETNFDQPLLDAGNGQKIPTYSTSFGSTVSFDIDGLYPRRGNDGNPYLHVVLAFKNEGTVPVKLLSVVDNGTNGLANTHLRFAIRGAGLLWPEYTYGLTLNNIMAAAPLSKLELIAPNTIELLEFKVYLHEDAPNATQAWATQNVKLKFNFVQYNQ